MKMRIAILIVAILLALAVITPLASAQDDDNGAATATPSSTGTATLAPGPTPAQGAIPGRYIVVLEEEARDPTAVAREHAQRHGAEVLHTYQHALDGYAARIPDRRLDEVLAEERVGYVERDATVTTAAQTRPWGIDKVDADISSTRAGNGAVSNVNAYIIDTGIDKNHADLNVAGHVNFARGQNTDRNGHGTHVAGTVAAKDNKSGVVGVAPGARLIGVKVLDHRGEGTVSGVIDGVDWVTANAQKPAVANMSLVTGRSKALDTAVRESVDSGIFYSVAAGNDDADVRNYSPARAGAGTNTG